jgi:hypothetical protein
LGVALADKAEGMTAPRTPIWPDEPNIFTDELPVAPDVLVETEAAFFARAAKRVQEFETGTRTKAFAHISVEPDELPTPHPIGQGR